MPPSSKLSAPARKMFIQQLKPPHCKQTKLVASSKMKWTVALDMDDINRRLPFDIVWLQGVVSKYDKASDFAMIDDTTGTARVELHDVRKLKKLSETDSLLEEGSYAIVVGTIIEIGDNPLVRALKCSELKNPEIHKHLWRSEVIHQQQFISRTMGSEITEEGFS